MSKYDQTFKEEAVRLALSSPQTIAKTARDLGIKDNTLYNWISVAKSQAEPKDLGSGSSNLIEELNRLRKDNARLKEERDILKKATMFFAKETR